MTNPLLAKLAKTGKAESSILSQSPFFNEKDAISVGVPIIDIAFSGDIDAGLVPGLTILAGDSKTYKTLLALKCAAAFQKKYADGIVILYDSEFGITPEYLKDQGIDAERVLHVPIKTVEELKADMAQKLEAIKRGDKVFFMLDSLGVLASRKETADALSDKDTVDMTRAKAIRSWLRIITPHLSTKDIPCIVINHIYMEMGSNYPKAIVGGGDAVMLMANQVFITTKSQEKDSGEKLVGWNFNLFVDKSRFVKEKSKLTFQVFYDGGLNIYSGLLDIALESGHATNPTQGYYSKKGDDKKLRRSQTNTPEFWGSILEDKTFKDFIKSKFSLAYVPGE